MARDSQRLEGVIEPAMKVLVTIFQPGKHEVDEFQQARLAGTVLATWARLRQSESAQEAVYFAMARELADDKAQLAEYIRITMPQVPLAKELKVKALAQG